VGRPGAGRRSGTSLQLPLGRGPLPRPPTLGAMKFLAAAVAALAVALTLVGCGGGESQAVRPETITISLPSVTPARDVFRTDTATTSSASASAAARPSARAAAGTASRAAASVRVTPLAPAAGARLNGVSVWIPYWGLASAVTTAIDNDSVVKVAHPFIDEITHSSTVVDQSGGQAGAVSAELAAHHITVVPTVTETAGMKTFTATLANPQKQAALRRALLGIAEQPGNDGIDLDFEDMAYGSGDPAQATRLARLYPQFLGRLCSALHAAGRSCEVTVMAKNTPGLSDADGLNTGVYDYAALAQVADRVQLMAYDDHVPSGASGPIAPWPWVESVLDYALTQIPADKVVLGIPAYGYDWSSKGGGTSLTGSGAEALAASVRSGIGWSETDAEPYFSYSTGKKQQKVSHTVWFEDPTSIYDRAVLAADDKLAGIALWSAGDEEPSTWTMLARIPRSG
jgi:spore germination protein